MGGGAGPDGAGSGRALSARGRDQGRTLGAGAGPGGGPLTQGAGSGGGTSERGGRALDDGSGAWGSHPESSTASGLWASLSAAGANYRPRSGAAPGKACAGGRAGSDSHLGLPRHTQTEGDSSPFIPVFQEGLWSYRREPGGPRKVGPMASDSPHSFHWDHTQTLGEEVK